MANNQQMFTLILDQAIKDDAVDIAMSQDQISGFTLSDAYGFSHQHVQYDVKEQVEGYRHLYRLDVIHSAEQLDQLLKAFKQLNARFKLKYWVTPVLSSGEL